MLLNKDQRKEKRQKEGKEEGREGRKREGKKTSIDHGNPEPKDMAGVMQSLSVVNVTLVSPLTVLFIAL